MGRVSSFVKDSVAELKKVVWPSREEVRSSAKVVVISVIIISLILGGIDLILAAAVSAIF